MYSSASAQKYLRQIYNKEPELLIAQACKLYSGGDPALAARLCTYVMAGWFKFSGAMLAVIDCKRSLPISCFLTQVDDTIEGLISHNSEVARIAVRGGGVSGDWSLVRPSSAVSPGPIGFMSTVNALIRAYRGQARRGSYAAYMDISHPAVMEFIKMRIPGGDLDRKNLNMHHAVNVTDKFMRAVIADERWALINPHTQEVQDTLMARHVWQELLETRYRTGEPYVNFIDTARRNLPTHMRAQGFEINCSNLCNEIHLPTSIDMTAICCLTSLNLTHYDDWKDTEVVGDLIEMLDNVIQHFIDAAPDTLANSKKGAELFRPLGLGTLGLAQLYQKRGIPFDSEEAACLNKTLFASIKRKAVARSEQLAARRGEPFVMSGRGRRNSHLLAVAPTANSATLLNTSPSIEPWPSNAYTTRSKSGSALIKNPELETLLVSLGQDTPKVWTSITLTNGSVQHLDFLSDKQKAVFKTAYEIDQFQIIRQAADRQKFICQGQSLTLFLNKNTSRETMHELHHTAWESGCKGLYYIRTKAGHKVEQLAECAGCQA